MLSNNRVKAIMRALAYPQKTIDLIDDIRKSPPSRKVQGGKRNVSGRFGSIKMGCTIQFEGWVELAAIYEMEFDHECLELLDQPPVIPLKTPIKTYPTYIHHPDFFVILGKEAGWLQCKRESELERISQEKPWLYLKDDDGHWRCPPGEEYANQFGLKFWVKSEKDYSWELIENLEYLEDFYDEVIDVPGEALTTIHDLVRKNPGISTTKLLALNPKIETDHLLALIAQNKIYLDLKQFRLSQPDTTAFFSSFELCEAYSVIQSRKREKACLFTDIDNWKSCVIDGIPYEIINPGISEFWLKKIVAQDEESKPFRVSRVDFTDYVERGKITGSAGLEDEFLVEAMEIVNSASPEQLIKANERYRVIAPIVDEGLKSWNGNISDRTVRDWVRKYRLAEARYRLGFVGLIDYNPGKGNYGSKLDSRSEARANKIIAEEFENDKQPPLRTVYGRLLKVLEEENLPRLSNKTFNKLVQARKGPEQTKKRQGERAAEQVRPKHLYIEAETPRHGSYPMHILHIDHSPLDIELRHSQNGKVIGRPWLSIAICTFTRRIVAFSLSYDPPSKRTCMVLLREIVRRNRRLPKWLAVDNGSEFGSVYFETTSALFGCHVLKRPPGKPKFGSVCERIFRTVHTQFIYNLAGNTQIMKKVRMATKSHDPKNLATWSLWELYVALEEYFYEVYDTIEHPVLGQSPREAFAQGCILHAYRKHKSIPYNEHFINLTYPTTGKGEAKVIPTEGVKINYNYYWSDMFMDGKVAGSKVPVRYDPFDMRTAKALINKVWITCKCGRPEFEGRSEKEIQILTNELKGKDTNHGRTYNATSQKIADNIISAERNNAKVVAQREKDLEQGGLLKLIMGGKSFASQEQASKEETNPDKQRGDVIPLSTKRTSRQEHSSSFDMIEEW